MAELDESIVKDFAGRILIALGDKPKDNRLGMTHIIQFVRDSHSTAEETDRYRRIGDNVPKYVLAAVDSLVREGRIKDNSKTGEAYALT